MSTGKPSVVNRPLTSDPMVSFTLPSNLYLDAATYELEKQRIFYKEWHFISHISQLQNAGDYQSLKIADEEVFVIRGKDSQLRGFYNVCKHRAHHLVQGQGNCRAIVCPYHAWCYDLDGSLFNAPMTQALPAFDKKQFGLTPIRVDEMCGLVFVNLDANAVPLAQRANGLEQDIRARAPWIDEIDSVQNITFGSSTLAANWKVVVDNFVECYHCDHAHPAFVDMISMPDYENDIAATWSRQTGTKTSPKNTAYHFTENAAVQGSVFWYLWPTTTMNIIPGVKSMQVLSILPTGIGTSSFSGQGVTAGETLSEDTRRYLFEELGQEDQDLVESVQRGLNSRSYHQGPFVVDQDRSGRAEHALHHFHQMVLSALQ